MFLPGSSVIIVVPICSNVMAPSDLHRRAPDPSAGLFADRLNRREQEWPDAPGPLNKSGRQGYYCGPSRNLAITFAGAFNVIVCGLAGPVNAPWKLSNRYPDPGLAVTVSLLPAS